MSNKQPGLLSRNRNFLIKCFNAALVIAVVLAYNTWAINAAAADAATQAQMDADAAAAREEAGAHGPYATDGVFTGSAQGYGGTVTTQVTIEGGYITDVQVVDHSGETDAYFEQASVLEGRIWAAQGTNVDTVSGATFSSAGIINGVNAALAQSGVYGAGE